MYSAVLNAVFGKPDIPGDTWTKRLVVIVGDVTNGRSAVFKHLANDPNFVHKRITVEISDSYSFEHFDIAIEGHHFSVLEVPSALTSGFMWDIHYMNAILK